MGCRHPLLAVGPLASAPKEAIYMQGDYPILNAAEGALSALYWVRF